MERNENWSVYVNSEPMTYPKEVNKLIHLYTGSAHYFCTFTGKWFKTLDGKLLTLYNPVFWKYIDDLPNKIVVKYLENRCQNPFGSLNCDKYINGECISSEDCIYKTGYNQYLAYNE